MQTGRRIRVAAGSGLLATDPNLNLFNATLAQNAGINASILLPEGIAAGRNAMCLVEGIQISSFDQNDWELWFWANSLFQVSAKGAGNEGIGEGFRGFWRFAVAGGDGKQIGGTGLYYYYIDGLGLHYEDLDAQTASPPVPTNGPDPRYINTSNGKRGAYLNVTLVNRSAGAKTAGEWFHIAFTLQPEQGQ